MSLVSREVIADSIELVARANHVRRARDPRRLRQDDSRRRDGARAAGHSRSRALWRVDCAGTSGRARTSPSRTSSRPSARSIAGKLGAAEFAALENAACPGAGACGGQFTANTMATACEFLGLSPFGSAAVPAMDAGKDDVSRQAGALAVDLLGRGLRPRQILTPAAFENAIAAVAATGGSTNAVLHLMAIAKEAGRTAEPRGLRPHQRLGAAPCRPQAWRPIRRDRLLCRRRHAGHRAAARRSGPAAPRIHHRHRPQYRRRSSQGVRNAWTRGRPSARLAAAGRGRPRHSPRQPCSSRLRGQGDENHAAAAPRTSEGL